MSADRRDPILSPEVTTDLSILRQREMEGLKKEIISQRRSMEPLMVRPKDERVTDYKESESTNSNVRRLLYGRLTTEKSSRLSIG
jgi:hypothetical protein